MAVRLSVQPSVGMEQLDSHQTDICEIRYLSIFRKYVEKIQISLKSNKNNGTVYEDQYTLCLSYVAQFFLEREPFETICREIQDIRFIANNFFFRKSCRL